MEEEHRATSGKRGIFSDFEGKCKKQQIHNGNVGRCEVRQCSQT